ncbi:MAG: PAS domain S-box protein [Pseudomonadota bacterium]
MIAELQTAIVNSPPKRRFGDQLTAGDKVKVRVERHALLLRGAPTAIAVSALLAVVTLATAWSLLDRAVIGVWAAAVVALAILRMGLWFAYMRRRHAAHGLFKFTRWHVIGMAVNGALWGALAPMFASGGLMNHAYLPFVIAGMTAATIASAGASWRAVLAFNIPALVPLAASYALVSGTDGLVIAGVVSMYGVATAYLAWTTQQMITRSIRLRSRNADLLAALSKQADAAHEAEQRFRALVESSKDVTLIFSPEGAVRYASPSVERALGAPPRSLIGKTTRDLVHPDDFQIFKAVGERSLSNIGEVVPLSQVCFKAADGEYRPLAGRLTNMLYVPGVEGFVFNGGLIEPSSSPHWRAAE